MNKNILVPRVSIIAGVAHAGDAISETVVADLESLDLLSRQRRQNIDVRVYCNSATVEDTRVCVVDDWREVLRQPHFQTSDILVYHFGIHNKLHDTVSFARRDSTVVHFFHNVTPPQYCKRSDEDLFHRSFQQIEMFRVADVHLCASRFSARQLEEYLGATVEVVPLFGPNESTQRGRRTRGTQDVVNVLYCGRFAEGKGLTTLFDALARIPADPSRPLSVTLAGMADFSDQHYVSSLQLMAKHLPDGVTARFVFNLSSEELRTEYAKADIFVLPSFHEGFGMTAVEALSFETPLICSNAGALPEVTNGLALSFQAGDSRALAEKLVRFREALWREHILCDAGEFARDVWACRAREHAASLSRNAYIDEAIKRFGGWVDSVRAPSVSYLDRLQEHMTDVHGPSEVSVRADEAAVRGALIGLGAVDLMERDFDRGLTALLRWPFHREQSESDLAYWRSEASRLGIPRLVRHLAESRDVRSSQVRQQVGVFLQALLADAKLPDMTKENVTAIAGQLTMEQVDVELLLGTMEQLDIELLLGTTMELWDFVREAYRLVLRRDPDPAGFETYYSALNSGRMTKRGVMESMLRSTERSIAVNPDKRRLILEVNQKAFLLEKRDVSNADFLRSAYLLILARDADADGFRTYITKLDTGKLTRKALLTDMLKSKERTALVARMRR